MAEDNNKPRPTLRDEAEEFVQSMFGASPSPPAHRLWTLLSRIDREAFERGKQAAESQPVTPPQPAGKAELTELEQRSLLVLVKSWARSCDSAVAGRTWDVICYFVADLRAAAVAKVEMERVRKERAEAELDLQQRRDEDARLAPGRAARDEELYQFRDWGRHVAGVSSECSSNAIRDACDAKISQLQREVALKPYTTPLTDAQVEELAELMRETMYPPEKPWALWEQMSEGTRNEYRQLVRAIAPRIARVQLRELTEEELRDAEQRARNAACNAYARHKPLWNVAFREAFADRIRELAQTEAPGKTSAVEGGS